MIQEVLEAFPEHFEEILKSRDIKPTDFRLLSSGQIFTTQIYSWMSGSSYPSLKNLLLLSEILNLSLEEIVGIAPTK